jgi:hypothetical protein
MAAEGLPKVCPDVSESARPWGGQWCGLEWTGWVPLAREAIGAAAPKLPGVYRIRRPDSLEGRLLYIGQTGRTLRERLLSLAAGANAAECPFNDPHTAAPHLWLLRHVDGVRLECSCAPVSGNVQILHGTEDMLLWRHRVETGCSAEANYGRFYPGYARPTNRWIVRGGRANTRIPGRKAVALSQSDARVDFSVSRPALRGEAGPLQASWWQRALLTEVRSLPSGPAVYCIHDRGAEEPVYVGETLSLPTRAATHAVASWRVREPWLAYLPLPEGTPKHVLRELESDLLGWHFEQTGRAPLAQYSLEPSRRHNRTVEVAK